MTKENSFRTSTNDEDHLSSNSELVNYINEYFWPRIQACTMRIVYSLRDAIGENKPIKRQWILHVRDHDFLRLIR